MLIFPAIDIQNRQCVRLVKGDFATAHRVAEDPWPPRKPSGRPGRSGSIWWIWTAAKTGVKTNADIFKAVARDSGLKVELGGRDPDMPPSRNILPPASPAAFWAPPL